MAASLAKRPRIYVAGPYSTGDAMANIRRALSVADCLIALEAAPYVPHLSGFFDLLFPHPWAFWIEQDLQWLACCHALVRLPGLSAGAGIEVDQARRLGLPVFALGEDLSLPGDFLSWLAAWSEPKPADPSGEDNRERSAQ